MCTNNTRSWFFEVIFHILELYVVCYSVVDWLQSSSPNCLLVILCLWLSPYSLVVQTVWHVKENFIEKVAPVVQTLFSLLKLLITTEEILPTLIAELSKEQWRTNQKYPSHSKVNLALWSKCKLSDQLSQVRLLKLSSNTTDASSWPLININN